MFKRISIILLILFTLLAFTIGAGAVAAGLFVEKDAANTYVNYVDADGTSIMKIDDTDGVTIASYTAVSTYTGMIVTGTTDASSLTTGSVTTAGGMSVAKQLYLGDDLDMSVSVSGTYDITLLKNVADALSIVDTTPADLIVFCTTTGSNLITITPALTVTGAIRCDSTTTSTSTTTGSIQTDGGIGIAGTLWVGTTSRLVGNVQMDGTLTVSADAAGKDVKIYGNTTLYYTLFDADSDTNGAWFIGGADQKGLDMTWYSTTASSYMKWDQSADDLLLAGAGVVFSGTQAEGITFGGTVTNEVIKIGGTYDHGIRFTEDMVATDVTNSFINIGDYTTGIAVVPNGANMFGVMHNVTIAVNVAYWYQAYYTKITTSGTTTTTSIAGHALRMNVASSLASAYGIQCHTNVSAGADATGEIVSVSAYVDLDTGDSTSDRIVALQAMITGDGTAGTVTGDAIVAYFVNAGTVVTTDDILKLYNQSAATTAEMLEIENDGTVTTMLSINNDLTATTGILIAGTMTTGIDFGDSNTTALNVGSCTTGIDFDGTIVTAIDIGSSTTGINLTGTCTDGIIFSGTVSDEAIQIGGAYDHGIRFAEDPVAGDVTNSFINVGDYTTGIAVAPTTANMFGVMHNVTVAVNVAYWYQAYYTKITTSGTTTSTSIAGHALRMNVATSIEAAYGIQCHTNITAGADVTQEVASISTMVDMGTGDTTTDRVVALQALITGSGTAGTVTGLLHVAYFGNRGTVIDTDAIVFIHNQSAAVSDVAVEFDLDGTVTNVWEFNGTVCDAFTTADAGAADVDSQDRYVLIPVKVAGVTEQLYIIAAETWN